MRFAALAAASALILTACSQAREPGPAATAAEPAAVLAGVDLSKPVRAVGTEPFWSVELTGTEMVYTAPEPPEQRAPQPRPAIQGTTATFAAKAPDGAAFSVMLAATECSDGMSDRTYPLSAIVTLGDRTLTGCAASSSALVAAGEGRPVAEKAQPAP